MAHMVNKEQPQLSLGLFFRTRIGSGEFDPLYRAYFFAFP